MRLRADAWLPVAASLLLLGGCAAGAGGGASPTLAPGPSATRPWLLYASGQAPPGPTPGRSVAPSVTGLPFSPLASAATCDIAWPNDVGQVLIPLIVTPGTRSLKVQWPNRYGSTYRVTAVDQRLVKGAQPEPKWVTVATGSGCTGTATLSGLVSGNPYIVWLDAPGTPRGVDNSRSLYTGRSGVVVPL
jgi:hypothetical protein